MNPAAPGDSDSNQNPQISMPEHSDPQQENPQQENPQQKNNVTAKTQSGESPKGHGSKFDHKADAAIAALLTCRTIEEAAKTAGIGVQTLMRWMRNRKFNARYRRAGRKVLDQATMRLVHVTPAAVTTLQKVMVDSNAPASARLRSAHHVLTHAEKAFNLGDMEARLARLERGMRRKKI